LERDAASGEIQPAHTETTPRSKACLLSAIIASIDTQEANMAPTSLQAKKAYYAKVRQSNYAASLRLEGFDTTPEDGERALPSKESVLNSYRTKRS
jgi:hypothetical protein